MPAWGQSDGGPLNEQQVNDLTMLIRRGDWDHVLEASIASSGGVPTPPPVPTVPAGPDRGKALFEQQCTTCHKSNDFPDGGTVGPDLTGLATHETSPVVGVDVTEEGLAAWIIDPQSIKPGTIMPAYGGATDWGEDEVDAVVEYLLTLQ
jgi:mono/diheme cytochrome c family protein